MMTSDYRQAPPLGGPIGGSAAIDEEYDYKASSPRSGGVGPSSPSSYASSPRSGSKATTMSPSRSVDGDEALMDLAQLEELHVEAEKMKALGNKHMAEAEYTRAYNAYSAALQLSPVGPSSHVFLRFVTSLFFCFSALIWLPWT